MRVYRRFFLFFLLLICVLCVGKSYAVSSQSSSMQNSQLHGAYRFERAHWMYVHLAGTPRQIGYEHGYLLAPEIEDTFHAIRMESTHNSKRNWRFFRSTAKTIYWPHIETQYREELQGIADGLKAHGVSDVDVWDVVALNGFMETGEYYLPWLQAGHGVAAKPPGRCSAC